MTDPNKAEARNEELDLEELKEAAGGISGLSGPGGTTFLKQNLGGTAGPGGTTYLKQNMGTTSGPGVTTFPKTNVAGSAGPGGDDI